MLERRTRRFGGTSALLAVSASILTLASPRVEGQTAAFRPGLPGVGASGAAAPPESNELEELLSVLAEETEVATRTKMNADFVPGIVTVLHGDEMEALGARNAAEALAIVPGVLLERDSIGVYYVQLRGIDYYRNNGSLRVLVDGKSLSRESSGIGGSVLTMPIEHIERIEVIRGPGSGVYGDFAFVGLVNIVTRRDRTAAWAAGGRGSVRTGGFTLGSGVLPGPVRVSAGGSIHRSDRGDVPSSTVDGSGVARDFLRGDDSRAFGTLALDWNGFSLNVAALHRKLDLSAVLTPAGVRDFFEKSESVEARKSFAFGPDRHVDVSVGYLRNDLRDQRTFFDGRRWDATLEAGWRLGRHTLLAQASLGTSRILDATLFLPPAGPGQPPRTLRLIDVDQDFSSALLQDRIEIGKSVDVTAGVRWDRQSDVGSRVTPRVAAVWRLSSSSTLKAQWADGFRAPFFFQVYSFSPDQSSGVDFETIRTLELGYIHRREGMVGRLTVFRSRMDDLIRPPAGANPFHTNAYEARANGVELELSQQLGDAVKVIGNLSWVDTDDNRQLPAGSSDDSFGEARWLWNLAIVANPWRDLVFGAHWHHAGTRQGTPLTSERIPGFELVNVTLTWRPSWLRALSLRAQVRDLLDDDAVHAYRLPPSTVQRFVYEGRVWSVQGSWKF